MLDSNGFSKKEYNDILNEMVSKAKEQFGADVNTSALTPLGIILRIFAWFISICWDNAERVYNSGFVKKAEGVQLDYLGGNLGLQREPATNAYVDLTITGTPGFKVSIGTQFTTANGMYFMLIEDVTLDASGNGTGQAASVTTGAGNNVAANTITKQAQPVEDIKSVTNPQPSSGGQDEEDDSNYRKRLVTISEGSGAATSNAIITALINTPAVRSATAIFNRTMQTDADGNPPKSVHAYVLGGTAADIGQALFNSISAGTQTVGSQQVTVIDLSGAGHVISFDYAAEVQIFVKVTITTNAAFEVNGSQQVKDAIVAYIGGVDSSGTENNGLGMGQSVKISRMYGAVYAVKGIDDVTIQIGKSADTLGTVNVDIAPREVAQVMIANIEVDISA